MANEKKVSISHRTVACYKCDYEMVTTGGGVVNGWLPMSRREQRRARKAAKNLVMYKMYGRRPWVHCYEPRDWLYSGTCCANPGSTCPTKRQRMDHLRERTGFNKLNQWIERRWPK